VVVEKGRVIGHGARADVFAWGEDKCLKLYWKGTDPAGVAGEAEATRIIHQAGLAVPECFGTITVEERPGILFEWIKGPAMGAVLLRHPWLAGRLARLMAELHAAMHEIVVPDIYPAQRPGLVRCISAAGQLSGEVKEAVLRALATLPDDNRLCHTDLHPGNILMGPGGPVIIDWQSPRRGSAVADVARTVLLLRGTVRHIKQPLARGAVSLLTPVFLQAYLRRYGQLRPLPRREIERWLPVLAAARLAEDIEPEEESLVSLATTVLRG